MADKKPQMLGATAFKPVERHGIEAISWFLYDKNTGAIMGRTCKSWALITVFYIIYYSFLAAFWAICFVVFWNTTIDLKQPRWLNENSRIGESPGIGVRPRQSDALMDSGMFVFNHKEPKEKDGIEGFEGWVERTQDFLDDTYWDNQEDCIKHCEDKEDCDPEEKMRTFCRYLPKKGAKKEDIRFLRKLDSNGNPETEDDKISAGDRKEKFYHFDRSRLGNCTEGNKYGFEAGKPCILLKLNKIYGVEHKYFNNVTEAEKLLKEKGRPGLPEGLKKHINSKVYKDHVWVDCHGENPYDNEMLGENGVAYYPKSRGFSSVFYPYENAPGYQTPLVAVQFLNLKPGHLYHIECRAYAGNIKYDRNDREGKAHFEIMMHNNHTAACVKDTCKKTSILKPQ